MTAAKGGLSRSPRQVVRKLLQMKDLSVKLRSPILGIDSTLGAPMDIAMPQPRVADGLDRLTRMATPIPERQARGSVAFDEELPRVLRAYLIAASGSTRSVPLKLNALSLTHTVNLIGNPRIRATRTILQDGPIDIRAIEPLPGNLSVHSPAPACTIAGPPVRDKTARMREFPHIRSGVNLELLDPQEHESFLREAESLKGVPALRGELLALFRNVPVELVSKSHFLEGKKLLLYTLDSECKLTRTRVHDLGIVRDPVAGKTHMVVHRTRFKSVTLS